LAKTGDFCQALANFAAGRFWILPRFGKTGPFLPNLGKLNIKEKTRKTAYFP
jgi:hypothetical protein